MNLLHRVSEIADATPEDRNRYVDFLRVAAIAAVVVGHWIIIDVRIVDGLPRGDNVLEEVAWTHWGTWVFQVIPVFFAVGGYANAASWRSHRDRGGGWGTWLRRRSARLLWPTTVFVAVGVAVTQLAAAAGAPRGVLDQAAWAVAIILWFLAGYLGVAALTPLTLGAHDRWGWRFAAGVVAVVAVLEVLRFAADLEAPALANYGLVWGAVHQLGYLWRDGALTAARRPVLLAAGAAAALVALVVFGPYPVSMVGVPGAEVQNTAPPSMALLALGFAQVGILLSVRRRIVPHLRSRGLWRIVVGVNTVIMSVFLWHVVPVVVAAGGATILDVSFPGPPGSAAWLAFRPVWLAVLAILLVPVVLLTGRIERPPRLLRLPSTARAHPGASLALGLAGVTTAIVALVRLTLEGFWIGDAGLLPLWDVAALVVGFGLVLVGGSLGSPGRVDR